ncbi:MAG: hypothetical protein OXF67_03575 [Cyanobacteria bacterium MAG CAR4_bin_6]|nr:hypothetical protein [Cyanobacteria bacterium MAG CAR4_bin_6]
MTVAQRGSYAGGGGTGAKTVTIPVAGTITYSVATVNDSSAEANGSIAVTLGAGAGYRVGSRSTATVAVMDDDTLLISVADATVKEAEGVELAFRVRLSQARTGTVTVKYATRDGTATAGEDYVAASGSLSFAAGETEQTVQVLVYNDSYDEGEREALDATSSSNGQKFEGELAYGMPAFGDRLTLTSALTPGALLRQRHLRACLGLGPRRSAGTGGCRGNSPWRVRGKKAAVLVLPQNTPWGCASPSSSERLLPPAGLYLASLYSLVLQDSSRQREITPSVYGSRP